MKKSDLIAHVAQEEALPIQDAHRIVETVFDVIRSALAEGRRVELRGFGSFRVKRYGAYKGRNPKTGEPVAVAAKTLVLYKMGKELIELVNDGHPQRKGAR